MKTVAIIVQNIIQYYSVRPLIKLLLTKKNIQVDIIVFEPESYTEDYHSIAKDVKITIVKDGYQFIEKPKKEYTMTLAPYSDMITFKTKYKIGYVYGAATSKPSVTLLPELKKGFHAILLHDTYGAELYSVYAHTYIVPDLYLPSIHHKKTQDKPVVLFQPTYHDPSTISVAKCLQELKDKYYIITKSHHGTNNLSEEKEKKDILIEIADECYPSSQFIGPLLDKADVVLSDNSGSVMDALYVNIPVAIATPEITPNMKEIEPLQKSLIDSRIIPYTKEITKENIDKILKKALSDKQKTIQNDASDKLFPNKKGDADSWYQIIEKYLNNEIDQNYVKLHDYYTQAQDNTTKELINRINQLIQDNNSLTNKVAEYEKHLARNPLRRIKRFVCNRRRKHE